MKSSSLDHSAMFTTAPTAQRGARRHAVAWSFRSANDSHVPAATSFATTQKANGAGKRERLVSTRVDNPLCRWETDGGALSPETQRRPAAGRYRTDFTPIGPTPVNQAAPTCSRLVLSPLLADTRADTEEFRAEAAPTWTETSTAGASQSWM